MTQALVPISAPIRLDGKGTLDWEGLGVIAARMAPASSAFDLEEAIVRAVEQRGVDLGPPSRAAELRTLLHSELRPLAMLLLADDEFRALVERLEEELGEV